MGCLLLNLTSAQFYLDGRAVVSCTIPYARGEGVAIPPSDCNPDLSEIVLLISDAFWQFSISSSVSSTRTSI
jgi:hypothetical protein